MPTKKEAKKEEKIIKKEQLVEKKKAKEKNTKKEIKQIKSTTKKTAKTVTTKPKKEENEKTSNNKEKNKEEKEIAKVDIQEIQKVIKEERDSKKTVSEEEQKNMNGEVFKNIAIAIAIVIFLNFIILGFINIKNSVFIVDLKVFAVSLLAVAIGIFEYAYKKDSGKVAIYGVEILILSLCMLAFIYINIMLNSKFVIIAVLLTYAISIYYTAKSIVIYKKMKKQYLLNSMKEIIKK